MGMQFFTNFIDKIYIIHHIILYIFTRYHIIRNFNCPPLALSSIMFNGEVIFHSELVVFFEFAWRMNFFSGVVEAGSKLGLASNPMTVGKFSQPMYRNRTLMLWKLYLYLWLVTDVAAGRLDFPRITPFRVNLVGRTSSPPHLPASGSSPKRNLNEIFS